MTPEEREKAIECVGYSFVEDAGSHGLIITEVLVRYHSHDSVEDHSFVMKCVRRDA